jgi:hypothetical protein
MRAWLGWVIGLATVVGLAVPSVAFASAPGVNGDVAIDVTERDPGPPASVNNFTWLAAHDGSGLHRTGGPFPFQSYAPIRAVFSPDGTRVASTDQSRDSDNLVVIALATGKPLARPGPGIGALDAAWSPDGRRLAFEGVDPATGLSHIYVAPADGSAAPTVIASGSATTSADGGSSREDTRDPTWTQDGAEVVFVRSILISHPTGPADGAEQVRAVSPSGTGLRDLTPLVFQSADSGRTRLDVPDVAGSTVVAARTKTTCSPASCTSIFDIVTLPLAGGALTAITSPGDISLLPGVSPDGTRVLYSHVLTAAGGPAFEVREVHIDGTGDRRFAVDPAWDFLGRATWLPEQCRDTNGNGNPDDDGDGLCDNWETTGIDSDGDGTIDLDLPAMGADPRHRDVFVELDFMAPHQLEQLAVDVVVQAFADAPPVNPDGTSGIALHVDNGPGSVMDPRTGALWGARSRQDAVPHVDVLGTVAPSGTYEWGEFDLLRAAHFDAEREPAFHYAISGHGYGSPTEHSSGIARGIGGSDLLITLGAGCGPSDCTFGVNHQAGTFMHELGHNLGLRHGGTDDVNRKPNYLSIMNYAFQFTGLPRLSGPASFDYSRFAVQLDESALAESNGFGFAANDPISDFVTVGRCPTQPTQPQPWPFSGSLDFNCDANITTTGTVASDTNLDGTRTKLTGSQDWPRLLFKGGSIGSLGAAPRLLTSDRIEPPVEELLQDKQAIDDYLAARRTPPTPTGPGAPSPPPAAGGAARRGPPTLSRLRLGRKAFRARTHGQSIAGSGAVVVTYTLSAAGPVRFLVERSLAGRRQGSSCVAPRRAPRGRPCARQVRLHGSFAHAGHAGANHFTFTGRLANHALPPGRYRLVAVPLASDGTAGTPQHVPFRILR